ncbi:MAG: hypothetical protein B6U73_01625 [Desulfurococcales archaeon ex4484_204]|nr:MAG: hypothetical protein B6U73_01625 [Desulfurococcales archaeon ex4484_204]
MEGSEASKEERRRDVKELVAIIPPASQVLSRRGKKVRERRVRVRLKEGVKADELHISPQLASELGIKGRCELSVPGKKRMAFKSVLNDSVPLQEVWANEELMRERGVADNTLATIRGA